MKEIIKNKKKVVKPTKISNFRPMILSRHPSHDVLRNEMPRFKFRSCIRLGSTTHLEDTRSNGGGRVEVNSIQSIKNSSNKLLMKRCFTEAKVRTANWWEGNKDFPKEIEFPIVAKSHFGSRGNGNYLLKTKEELDSFKKNHTLSEYIFEKFYNYSREYRLHVTEDGCFYTCRKALKENTPEDKRWFRNDSNSVWILESNADFQKPSNWSKIEEECIKALKSIGLDFGACDVRVQSENDKDGKKRKETDFIVIEINSAPSFGDVTKQKYLETLPKILMRKYNL